MINKGWSDCNDVWNGLNKYPDGTKVLWKGLMYKIESHTRNDGYRHLGLNGLHNADCKSKRDIFNTKDKWCVACQKFIEPKRNESCSCGSGKKYKKCCLNNGGAK